MKNGYTAIPDWLLYGEDYTKLSLDEKVLYSVIIRRYELSVSKGDEWTDKEGNTFCYFSTEAVQELAGCSKGKALSMLKALEEIGLITRVNHGQGRPAFIYVNFPDTAADEKTNKNATQKSQNRTSKGSKKNPSEVPELDLCKSKNCTCEGSEAGPTEDLKPHPNYKETNYTESSYPHPSIISNHFGRMDRIGDGISARAMDYWRAKIRDQVAYDALAEYAPGLIDNIVDIMASLVLSRAKTHTIGGTTYSADVVRQKVLGMSWYTTKYIIDSLRSSHTVIHNPYAYITQCIMRADSTVAIKYAPCSANDD